MVADDQERGSGAVADDDDRIGIARAQQAV
jgi:hypothetical protein